MFVPVRMLVAAHFLPHIGNVFYHFGYLGGQHRNSARAALVNSIKPPPIVVHAVCEHGELTGPGPPAHLPAVAACACSAACLADSAAACVKA